jgi:hypothetical protein
MAWMAGNFKGNTSKASAILKTGNKNHTPRIGFSIPKTSHTNYLSMKLLFLMANCTLF